MLCLNLFDMTYKEIEPTTKYTTIDCLTSIYSLNITTPSNTWNLQMEVDMFNCVLKVMLIKDDKLFKYVYLQPDRYYFSVTDNTDFIIDFIDVENINLSRRENNVDT